MKRIIAVLGFLALTISIASAQRLPEIARPTNYKLLFNPDLDSAKFEGEETITLQVLKPTSEITLNAVDIDFHDVTITSGGATQKAKVSAEKEKEMVVLAVPKPLAAGTATVHVTYTGILNSEMRGFYLGKDDQGRKYAATQFEATDARRAFPSFDEPDYKATFDISVVSDKGLAAISNQKVASDTPGPGDKHTVRFATTAKMSAYLAALVVGNFEYVEGGSGWHSDPRLCHHGQEGDGEVRPRSRRRHSEVLRPLFWDQVSLRKARSYWPTRFLRGRDGEHGLHHFPGSSPAD